MISDERLTYKLFHFHSWNFKITTISSTQKSLIMRYPENILKQQHDIGSWYVDCSMLQMFHSINWDQYRLYFTDMLLITQCYICSPPLISMRVNVVSTNCTPCFIYSFPYFNRKSYQTQTKQFYDHKLKVKCQKNTNLWYI